MEEIMMSKRGMEAVGSSELLEVAGGISAAGLLKALKRAVEIFELIEPYIDDFADGFIDGYRSV